MARALLLLLLAGVARAVVIGPDYERAASDKVRALREHLFVTSNYDRLSLPTSNRSVAHGVEYSRAGTDVALMMRIFKVVGIDFAAAGTLQLFVWLGYRYIDERLAWDPEEWGGITQIYADPAEVWRPDIVPYNSRVFADTFEDRILTICA